MNTINMPFASAPRRYLTFLIGALLLLGVTSSLSAPSVGNIAYPLQGPELRVLSAGTTSQGVQLVEDPIPGPLEREAPDNTMTFIVGTPHMTAALEGLAPETLDRVNRIIIKSTLDEDGTVTASIRFHKRPGKAEGLRGVAPLPAPEPSHKHSQSD